MSKPFNQGTQVEQFVWRKLDLLLNNQSNQKTAADLAHLRHSLGKPVGTSPNTWDLIFGGLPENLMSKGNEPTAAEKAINAALTLFSVHQQGKSLDNPMSKQGESFASAVRKLAKDEDELKRIKRRFDQVCTAKSLEELTHHSRGIIQLLKREDLAFDYPKYAKDLYFFQFPRSRDRVLLRWGQDFYRVVKH